MSVNLLLKVQTKPGDMGCRPSKCADYAGCAVAIQARYRGYAARKQGHLPSALLPSKFKAPVKAAWAISFQHGVNLHNTLVAR